MRWVVVGLVLMLTVAVAASPTFEKVPTAAACSCPDCDSVRDSDVIIAGKVTSWSPRAPANQRPHVVPIELRVSVDQVYKGAAPPSLALLDSGSLNNLKNPSAIDVPDRFVWMGGAGGCQAFAVDPLGKYVVLGYTEGDELARTVWGPKVFFVGEESEWQESPDRATRLVSRLGEPRPPSVGDSPPTAETSDDWMFLSAIGAGCLLLTLLLVLVGPRRR